MINKQQASDLWVYDYKLQDEQGNTYDIVSVENSSYGDFVLYCCTGEGDDEYCDSILQKEIGTDYKIICRPLKEFLNIQDITDEMSVFEIETVLHHPEPFAVINHVAITKMYKHNLNMNFPEGTTINTDEI